MGRSSQPCEPCAPFMSAQPLLTASKVSAAGNMFNMAPEVHTGVKTPKWDVFSFGMMFAGVIVRSIRVAEQPFRPTPYPYDERFNMVIDARERLSLVGCSKLADVLSKCTNTSIDHRSDSSELVTLLSSLAPPLPLEHSAMSARHCATALPLPVDGAKSLADANARISTLLAEKVAARCWSSHFASRHEHSSCPGSWLFNAISPVTWICMLSLDRESSRSQSHD